jgi:hypothetical protein
MICHVDLAGPYTAEADGKTEMNLLHRTDDGRAVVFFGRVVGDAAYTYTLGTGPIGVDQFFYIIEGTTSCTTPEGVRHSWGPGSLVFVSEDEVGLEWEYSPGSQTAVVVLSPDESSPPAGA